MFYYQFTQTSWATAGKSTADPALQKEKTNRNMDILNVLS